MSPPSETSTTNGYFEWSTDAGSGAASNDAVVNSAEMRAVRALAEGVRSLFGFGVIGVMAARSDGSLSELVVTGPGQPDIRPFVAPASLSAWADRLDGAPAVGNVYLVRTHDDARHPAQPRTLEQMWHPEDWLVVHLQGRDGEFVGFMWAGQPHEQQPPSPSACAALERVARHLGQILAAAIDQRDLSEQSRLMATSRTVIRGASRVLDIDAVIKQAYAPLVTGLRAVGLWLHLFGLRPGEQSTLYTESAELTRLTADQERLAMRIGQDAWRQQRVGVVSRSRLRGGLLSGSEVEAVRTFLNDYGVGSLLFVPIGSETECLGTLIVARMPADALWSEPEIDIALDLGHDVGQALVNARSFEREHELVTQLQAADTHKTALMRTMSHEMKSPLTAILANLELLEDSLDSTPEARHAMTGIDRGSRRLLRVIDDLLALAENGDPDTPMTLGPVDLGALVEDAAALKKVEALRAGVIINVELAHGSRLVTGNASALDLLVTNLLSNAVKYSPDGGTVTLRLDAAGDEVSFTCTDQGIGISGDEIAKIYDEFFRSSHTRARAQPGTGLGLSIVDRIVRRHRGTIEVTSRLGAGTTFRTSLPATSMAAATA